MELLDLDSRSSRSDLHSKNRWRVDCARLDYQKISVSQNFTRSQISLTFLPAQCFGARCIFLPPPSQLTFFLGPMRVFPPVPANNQGVCGRRPSPAPSWAGCYWSRRENKVLISLEPCLLRAGCSGQVALWTVFLIETISIHFPMLQKGIETSGLSKSRTLVVEL